tara:strand:+ start:4720 stop:4965 length:246 start_codon:yes stop_codon:yes gene_type:complete
MENVYFISILISIIFLIFKIIDIKLLKRDEVVLKVIVRDTMVVFLSVFIGMLVSEQLGEVSVSKIFDTRDAVSAFTNNPEF